MPNLRNFFVSAKVLNQRGLVPLVLIILVVIGIAAGLYLIQNPAIFSPRADAGKNIWFVDSTGKEITATDSAIVQIKVVPSVVFPTGSIQSSSSKPVQPKVVISQDPNSEDNVKEYIDLSKNLTYIFSNAKPGKKIAYAKFIINGIEQKANPFPAIIELSPQAIPSPSTGVSSVKYFKFNYSTGDLAVEAFIVKVTNQEVIKRISDDLKDSRKLLVSGNVVLGNGGFNHSDIKNLSWYLDPKTITVGENFPEVCDYRPSILESDIINKRVDWAGKLFCPWGSKVAAVFDTPPPLVTPSPPIPGSVLDSDKDGFNDDQEIFMGTDPKKSCGVDAWPVDINNDGYINGQDVSKMIPFINGSKGYFKRYDLNQDKTITEKGDIVIIQANMLKSCLSK